MKNERLSIRLTKKEKQYIKKKSAKCKMTVSKYVVTSCLKEKIIVIHGINKLETEVRKIGNNLNQLTRLSHEGRITTPELKPLREDVSKLWQLLKLLVQKQQ